MPCPIYILADSPPSYSDQSSLAHLLETAGFSLPYIQALPFNHIMPINALKSAKDKSLWLCHAKNSTLKESVLMFSSWCSPLFAERCQETLRRIALLPEDTILVPLGSTALWLLTGLESISKWRGSRLLTAPDRFKTPFLTIGTHTPREINALLRLRAPVVIDLSRVFKETQRGGKAFTPFKALEKIAPTLEESHAFLNETLCHLALGKVKLSIDIEIKSNTLLCIAFASSAEKAFCLPFWKDIALKELKTLPLLRNHLLEVAVALRENTRISARYFSIEDELALTLKVRQILLHKNALLIGQNLTFEYQFFAHYWYCLPKTFFDTMTAQHVLNPGTPKDLGYLHSLYSEEYLYWKDDGKFWKDDATMNYPELWSYNCKDVLNTYSIYEAQEKLLKIEDLEEQNKEQIKRIDNFALIMYRGVKVDLTLRQAYLTPLFIVIGDLRRSVNRITQRDLNINSPKQLADFFYEELKMPVQKNAITKRPTTDDDALKTLAELDPLLLPLVQRINAVRSYGTAVTAVTSKPNYYTKRFHSAYNPAGPETYRLSSSTNVWDEGMNMQNATSGKRIL